METDLQLRLAQAIRARDTAANLHAHAAASGSEILLAYELQLRSMQRDVDRLEQALSLEKDDPVDITSTQQMMEKKRLLYRVA
jgi:hypothetical protein